MKSRYVQYEMDQRYKDPIPEIVNALNSYGGWTVGFDRQPKPPLRPAIEYLRQLALVRGDTALALVRYKAGPVAHNIVSRLEKIKPIGPVRLQAGPRFLIDTEMIDGGRTARVCLGCGQITSFGWASAYADYEMRLHVAVCDMWDELDDLASRLLFSTVAELEVKLDQFHAEGIL